MKFCGLKIKTSKEVLDRFKDFKEMVELETGKKIKIIQTDGGGEYEKWVARYLKECGIKHEITAHYSLEQNGVTEHTNRTILKRTKAILADMELLKKLWMEIASTVVHIKNCSPTNLSKEKPRMRHGMARSQIYHISGFSAAPCMSMYQRILEGSWISTLENVGWSAMEGQINGEHGMRKTRCYCF